MTSLRGTLSALMLLAASPLAFAQTMPVSTGGEMVVRKHVQAEEAQAILNHIAAIPGPAKRTTLKDLGLSAVATRLDVAGPISDTNLRMLLRAVGERLPEATVVTADNQFATVQLGSRAGADCCATRVTYIRAGEQWKQILEVWRSY
jgi:hypothetical protein